MESESKQVSVLIATPHELLNQGLSCLLQARGIKDLAHALTPLEAVVGLQSEPDVLLIDVLLPDFRLRAIAPHLKSTKTSIVLLMNKLVPVEIGMYARLGLRNFVSKTDCSDVLISAVKNAANNLSYNLEKAVKGAIPGEISMRESQVLKLLAQNYSLDEIGKALLLSRRTVGKHQENIKLKTDLYTRQELAELSLALQLTSYKDHPEIKIRF